ncbi:hypothetical protein ACTXT7_006767 [Hymenolepis weldensis]
MSGAVPSVHAIPPLFIEAQCTHVLTRVLTQDTAILANKKAMSEETYTPPLQVSQINPATLPKFLSEHASGLFVILDSYFKHNYIGVKFKKFHIHSISNHGNPVKVLVCRLSPTLYTIAKGDHPSASSQP